MTLSRRTLAAAALALSLCAGFGAPAVASDFPTKPVKFIVSWSPGGGADTLARQLAKGLTERWGQPVVVENKPGADATIGIQLMLQQPADGYTIGLIITSHAVHPSVRKALPYDLLRDFVAVTNVVEAPNLLVVNPKLPVKNVQELIALGKTRPLNFAAPGLGGPGHLGGVMFNSASGINALHIPYPGLKVFVKEGDVVEAGQPLVLLDSAELEAKRAQLIAQQELFQAKLDMMCNGPLSEQIAAAKAALEMSEARLQKLQAGWRREEVDMAKYDAEITN